MNPVIEAMNRLLPNYIADEYPELHGWTFQLYDTQMIDNDCETIVLLGRNAFTSQVYRNSFRFSRSMLDAVGNLSDVYNEGFRKMMFEMRHKIIEDETISVSNTIPELESLLNSLL